MEYQRNQAPQGILFDMDGTLLFTTQRAEQTWFHVFEQFVPQHHFAPELLSEVMSKVYTVYKRAIAKDPILQQKDRLHPFEVRKETIEQVLKHVGKTDTALAEAMVQAYEILREQHRCLAPFALETLEQLHKQNIRLALLTNGNARYQRHKIERHYLTTFFECILIEEEYGVGKPDPSIYQSALEQLHLVANQAWMVGDHLWFDVGAPQQLGIFALWFDPDQAGLPLDTQVRPDRIIHTLPELLSEIRTSTSN